ncbi:predicted protein [Pyrenophora tritici-repentis Pt-1C-BFP]|uniref:Uncharacterized protein n=1 Tax=Pyrenophora tritici-repentis (strain Pt-1C-BFP) TaxID=426418 RepID=B2WL34_PYRTR|nr:uncharacterized protein PTRG_10694 [Pyrenophora tritici-repentis Pt-1C-BFP]EDU43744.1 predicted protein [Pyrenophora tritici-repentis Pt-1C-BFP]
MSFCRSMSEIPALGKDVECCTMPVVAVAPACTIRNNSQEAKNQEPDMCLESGEVDWSWSDIRRDALDVRHRQGCGLI